jgi:hypothetical protein
MTIQATTNQQIAIAALNIEGHMNELAQGPLYVASSREQYRNDSGLVVTFTTTVREGATAEMVNETKRHFLEAAKAVYEFRAIASTDEKWSKRTDWNPPQAPHGEPRVNIFGDVVVTLGTGKVTVSVNKFTEYTSAFDMARHLLMVAECVKLPMNGHASSTPPVSTETARQALGSGGERRVGNSTPAPQASGQSDSGTPHFEQFPQNAEARAAFGMEYAGKVVSFTARKIEKKFDANTGDPEWQFFEIPTHQFPMVRSTLTYIRDEATKTYLPKLPNTIEGEWRVVCYVNKKADGKVYFNINKVEPVNVPHGDLSDKPALPTADQFAADYGLTTDNAPPVRQNDDDDGIPF